MAGDVPGTLAPVGRFAKRTYLSDRRVLVRPGRSGPYVRVFGREGGGSGSDTPSYFRGFAVVRA